MNKVTDIYEWNRAQGELIKYQLQEEEWLNEGGIPYSNIIFVDERIIVLNFYLKYIMEIDKNAHSIKKAIEYPKGFRFWIINFGRGEHLQHLMLLTKKYGCIQYEVICC